MQDSSRFLEEAEARTNDLVSGLFGKVLIDNCNKLKPSHILPPNWIDMAPNHRRT